MNIIVKHNRERHIIDALSSYVSGGVVYGGEASRISNRVHRSAMSARWNEYLRDYPPESGYELIDATTPEGWARLQEVVGITPVAAAPVAAAPVAVAPVAVAPPDQSGGDPNLDPSNRNRKPGKPTPGRCVVWSLDPQRSEEVQAAAFAAGHSWSSYGKNATFKEKRSLIIEAGHILYSNNNPPIKDDYPNHPFFDSLVEMDTIYDYFGVKKPELTIDRLVKPALLNMIKSMPGDDLVAGFLRRDLQLVLPKEIQDAGSDSIINWILTEKKGVTTPLPPGQHRTAGLDRRFSIECYADVSGIQHFSRTDRYQISGEVPAEIVDKALAHDDDGLITDWLFENRRSLDTNRISSSNDNYGDSEDTNMEINEIADSESVSEKMEEIKEQLGE